MTYLEHYAGLAMQALITCHVHRRYDTNQREIAEQAVRQAEAMCKQLEVNPWEEMSEVHRVLGELYNVMDETDENGNGLGGREAVAVHLASALRRSGGTTP